MSGYIGNPDAEAEHAQILSENGIHAARVALQGEVRSHCCDCDAPIPQLRIEAAQKAGHACERCVPCQSAYEQRPKARIKMLDRIL